VHRANIALLTDFGARDPYAAAMKGVIASRTDAAIHDLTHEIPPYDVVAAAWFLRQCEAWWPPATIFVCVVDPGVGTARRIVAVERNTHLFLAPDNGLLTFMDEGAARRFEITNAKHFLDSSSTTFHGRDRFAPVAAALARGVALDELGRPIDSTRKFDYTPPHRSGEVTVGQIVAVDRFGNAITDLEATSLPLPTLLGRVGDVAIDRVETTYGGAQPGPFFIVGSSGLLEISIANGSAAQKLGLTRGLSVEVWGA
jgi:S-adenosyl-L-methionine hydrolase (adenosine-forming)